MKDIITVINENRVNMYYKQILTYTISENDTRMSFEELLAEIGFKNMPDQSTWALPIGARLTSIDVVSKIKSWSKGSDVTIDEDDFVQIFRSKVVEMDSGKLLGIVSQKLVFDPKTQGLR